MKAASELGGCQGRITRRKLGSWGQGQKKGVHFWWGCSVSHEPPGS